MRVIVTEHAERQIAATASYIEHTYGKTYKKKFRQRVLHTIRILRSQPNSGAIEPLLSDLPRTYRSILVNRINKLIYTIDDDCIIIVACWDSRRDPATMPSEVN